MAQQVEENEKSKEEQKADKLKKATTEQGNELGAKNEEATKPETNTFPSNPDVEEQ